MRIICICVVRDEVDVIAETLRAAMRWSDRILVLDNGSTDGTWEVLQDLSSSHPALHLVGREGGIFREEMRGEIFARFGSEATSDDWWCRLDADEMYVDDPREFLAQVPIGFGFVRSATLNFYFTDRDLAEYTRNPTAWLARPVHERLRYYQNNWSEGRFVRHRPDLRWLGHIWPPNRGRIHRERIRLKHFQYRSPEQIARRLAIRQPQPGIFRHESSRSLAVPRPGEGHDWVFAWMKRTPMEPATWEHRVREAALCDYDAGDGRLVVREELMPALPRPALDVIRATLQASRIGALLLRPYLAWRHRRR